MRLACVLVLLSVCASAHAYQYALDDGDGDYNGGPIYDNIEVMWGTYFYTDPSADMITSLSVALGDIGDGRAISLHLFNDPDNDGDPANAIPLTSAAGFTAPHALDEFQSFDIPDTQVTGGFFVAALMELSSGGDYAMRWDSDTVMGRSWLYYGSYADGIILDDLGASPYILNMDNHVFPGTFMLRADAIPAPGSLAVLALFALSRRRRH